MGPGLPDLSEVKCRALGLGAEEEEAKEGDLPLFCEDFEDTDEASSLSEETAPFPSFCFWSQVSKRPSRSRRVLVEKVLQILQAAG